MIRPLWALRLLVLTGLSSSFPHAPSSAAAGTSIFSRSDTCVAASLTSCSSALPTNFCCPTSYACLALAANTTAMCCPGGSTCKRILPILCDIGLQSPSFNMSAIVKTTLLDYKLPTCGQACCPFGYQCETNGNTAVCVMKDDQSVLPDGVVLSSSSAVRSSTSSAAPTTSTTSTSDITTTTSANLTSTTATSSQQPSSTIIPTTTLVESPTSLYAGLPFPTDPFSASSPSPSPPPSSSPSSSTDKIVGGVIGAISGIVLFLFLFLWLRRRHARRTAITGALASGEPPLIGRRPNSPSYSHSRSGSKSSGPPLSARQISGPVMRLSTSLLRTDFIRKPSGGSSTSGSGSDGISPTNSPRYETYSQSNAPGHGHGHGHNNISQTAGLAHAMPPHPPPPTITVQRSSAVSQDSLIPSPLHVIPPYSKNAPLGHLNYQLDCSTPTIRLVDQKAALRPSMTQLHPGLGAYAESSAVAEGHGVGSQRDTTMTFMMHEAGLSDVQSGQPYMSHNR
ncbi:hypothetical protein BROUX41_004683 [Berkeleyomyces rouxiae]|uniref:uncharacterized protein n=1 Tax=Berkeleyomyces rouxiae TaxID=2035830 RepID=UPI003B7756DB